MTSISLNMITPVDPITAWHQIVRSGDIDALEGLLADDVAFHSPVVHTPEAGKARTLPYLSAAFLVFINDSFRYVREVVGERDAVLEFVVEIDGKTVNGVDMLKWNNDGKVIEFKVMLRPLKAVNLIHQKMGALLEATKPEDK